MAKVNFTEPLVIFLKKQNQKEKSIEITPTNELAFQHTADVIHPCNKPVQPNEVFEQYNDLSPIIDISDLQIEIDSGECFR